MSKRDRVEDDVVDEGKKLKKKKKDKKKEKKEKKRKEKEEEEEKKHKKTVESVARVEEVDDQAIAQARIVAASFPPADLPLVQRYFPHLSLSQMSLLGSLHTLVRQWNDRVNLISRKDADNIEERHILMSLLISKVWNPLKKATEGETKLMCVDIGTGGGFPGVPLAILFPQVHFTLVDTVAKKIDAVRHVVEALHMSNISCVRGRAEQQSALLNSVDCVLGRAVTALPEFLRWSGPMLRGPEAGIWYFKGTRWQEELEGSKCRPTQVVSLTSLLPGQENNPFFEGKFLLRFEYPVQMEAHIRHDTNKNMHAGKEEEERKKQREKFAAKKKGTKL